MDTSSSSSSSSSSHNLNLFVLFSESKRIINAHSRHFLALSVLFLVPLSFSLIIYPTIHSLLSQSNSIFTHPRLFASTKYLLQLDSITPQASPTLLPVLYTLFAVTLFLFAIATISYSTFHGFYGRPVKIVATLKSLLASFLPLCVTLIVSLVIVAFMDSVFVFFGGLVYKGLDLVGVLISFESRDFVWIAGFAVFVVGLSLIYLYVIWVLAPVVVVVESKWGYEALRRSAYLVRGMRGVALSLMVFFGLSMWLLIYACSRSVVNMPGVWGFDAMVFVFQTVITSGLVTWIMLLSMAAVAVLYLYCKAVRGELAFEVAEEFAGDFISLPFDDEKVPHVVSVIYG